MTLNETIAQQNARRDLQVATIRSELARIEKLMRFHGASTFGQHLDEVRLEILGKAEDALTFARQDLERLISIDFE